MGDSAVESPNARNRPQFPAYGPIEAILGFVLFYTIVDQATPAVLDLFDAVLPDVSSATVALGLAFFIWFVFAVMLFEQCRRQLATLGVIDTDATERGLASRVPWEVRTGGYAILFGMGSLVAWLTFETGVEAVVETIRILGTLDVEGVFPTEFAIVVVFFVSFSIATHSLDRLVVDAIRAMLEE